MYRSNIFCIFFSHRRRLWRSALLDRAVLEAPPPVTTIGALRTEICNACYYWQYQHIYNESGFLFRSCFAYELTSKGIHSPNARTHALTHSLTHSLGPLVTIRSHSSHCHHQTRPPRPLTLLPPTAPSHHGAQASHEQEE